MSNTDDSGTLILFNNQHALIPGGGVTMFAGDSFLLTDWADLVIGRQTFSLAAQWASWVLACRGLLTEGQFKYLLQALVARCLIGKTEVLTMYKMQSPDIRAHSPYLTIEDMWDLRSGGEQVFKKDELVDLANEIITVSPRDVSIFERQWFYRGDNPLSVEFLEYWHKCSPNHFDGKGQALVAIHFYEKKNKSILLGKGAWRQLFFEEIKVKIVKLANHEPESHGLSRYVALLYCITRDTKHKRKRQVMMEEITDIIAKIVINAIDPRSGKCALYHGSFFMCVYLTDPSISDSDKKKIISRVQSACREFALSYLFFVDDVLRDSR